MCPSAPEGRFDSPSDAERCLEAARAGSEEALGKLLETCRAYLLGIANDELDPELKGKLGGSDLVQETFLRAQTDFVQFRGKTHDEWLGWLRTILLNHLANVGRQFRGTGKRNIDLEVPLAGRPDGADELADEGETPSALARMRERDDQLRAALSQLTETQQQHIQWRNYEMLSFEEIGSRLGKSADAARKLWVRALEQLEQILDSSP